MDGRVWAPHTGARHGVRQLLGARGAVIVCELCQALDAERIYRTFAAVLEREADLEFAAVMVQTLNLILMTTPELAPLRALLKGLRTDPHAQAFFQALYRSWSHNAIATFTLCLLAQAYRHASDLVHALYVNATGGARWARGSCGGVGHPQCRDGDVRGVLCRCGQAGTAARVANLCLYGQRAFGLRAHSHGRREGGV
jgi:hypothetical protein